MSSLKHSEKAEYSEDYIKGVLHGLKIVSIYAGDKKGITEENVAFEIEEVKRWAVKQEETKEVKPTVKIELGEKAELLDGINAKLAIAGKLARELTEALLDIPIQPKEISGLISAKNLSPGFNKSINEAFAQKG